MVSVIIVAAGDGQRFGGTIPKQFIKIHDKEMIDYSIEKFLDNNIETYRINSGALNWKSSFGNKNTSIVTTDFSHNKHIYYIKKNVPDVTSFYYKEKLSGKTKDLNAFKKASKYRLVAMDKRNAKINKSYTYKW